MYFIANGIVLNQYNVGEYDKIVVLYTLEKGKIRTIFKSVNKPTAKLLPLTQIGNEVELHLYYLENTFLKVVGGKLIDDQFKIKQNYREYINLCKILELVDKLTFDFLADEKKYFLLRKAILLLKSSLDSSLLYLVFIFRWLKLCGYKPEIFRCTKCKKSVDDKIWWFSFSNSGLVCDICKRKSFLFNNKNETRVSYASIKTIQNFYNLSGEEIAKQKISKEIFDEIENIAGNYLKYYLHSPLKSSYSLTGGTIL